MKESENKLILFKPSALIVISGNFSLLQHKLYDGLLYCAQENLMEDVRNNEFFIDLDELLKISTIRKTRTERAVKALKGIADTGVEVNLLNRDKSGLWEKGKLYHLISHIEFIKNPQNTKLKIRFALPDTVLEAMRDIAKNYNIRIALEKLGIII